MTGRLLYVMEESSSKLHDSHPSPWWCMCHNSFTCDLRLRVLAILLVINGTYLQCLEKSLVPFRVSKNLSSIHSSDLMQNPLIVPVKVLKGHKVVEELGRLTVTPFGISLRDEVKQYCTSLCRKLSHLFFFQ